MEGRSTKTWVLHRNTLFHLIASHESDNEHNTVELEGNNSKEVMKECYDFSENDQCTGTVTRSRAKNTPA